MKNKIMLFSMVLMLVTSLVVAGCAAPAPEAAKTLKIGVCATVTGFGSEGHLPILDGHELAAEWINEKGGITVDGQQYLIELVVADGKGSVEGYSAAARKLVYDHKVKFLMGGIEASYKLAIGAVTEPAKVIDTVIYTVGLPDALPPYTFNTGFSTVEGMIGSMAYLVEAYPGVKTLSMINCGDVSADVLPGWLDKEAEKYGLSVIDNNTWPYDIIDWYPFITKCLVKDPDVIFYTNGWPSHVGGILKAARELGFTGPVCGMNNISPYEILAIAGPEASTDYFSCNWTLDTTLPDMPPIMKEVIQMAEAKFGEAHSNSFWGFNSLWFIVQAIEEAQSFDTTEVAEAWRSMESMESVAGTAKMGGIEVFGVRQRVQVPMEIGGLMNGEVTHFQWMTLDIE